MRLTVCCPACGLTGSNEDPHEVLYKILDEPKLSGKDDLAYQPIRCGSCGHEFYPLAVIGGELISNFFDETGKRWEGDQPDCFYSQMIVKGGDLLAGAGVEVLEVSEGIQAVEVRKCSDVGIVGPEPDADV